MTFVLLAHIILMISSIIATSTMTVAAATSYQVSKKLIHYNLATTTTGVLCGAALLISQPLGAKCALLFSYTVAFAIAYTFITRRNQSLVLSGS